MKKILQSYIVDLPAHNSWIKTFHIVENISTKEISVIAVHHYNDGNILEIQYSISEFEYEFKINIADLI